MLPLASGAGRKRRRSISCLLGTTTRRNPARLGELRRVFDVHARRVWRVVRTLNHIGFPHETRGVTEECRLKHCHRAEMALACAMVISLRRRGISARMMIVGRGLSDRVGVAAKQLALELLELSAKDTDGDYHQEPFRQVEQGDEHRCKRFRWRVSLCQAGTRCATGKARRLQST